MNNQPPYIQELEKKTYDALKSRYGYTNVMQTPRLKKIIVTTTTGSIKDPKKKTLMGDRLSKITGQKVSQKLSKKSIATFKVREGDAVGYQVTLRGKRMHDFMNKLVLIAFPRTRDFRGIDPKSIDEMGNISTGIKESSVFPETADEELKDVFGIGVTIVTSGKTKDETRAMLESLGFPFKKEVRE